MVSTEVSTVRQIKRPGTGMMQLVLHEKEGGGDVLTADPKLCVFLCV